MNDIARNCRNICIGGSAFGGLVLAILLSQGDRGWFAGLLIGALLGLAAAMLLLAFVCKGDAGQDSAETDTNDGAVSRAPAPSPATPPIVGAAGGRSAPPAAGPEPRAAATPAATPAAEPEPRQARSASPDEANGTPVLADQIAELEAERDAQPEMPDAVAAEAVRPPELLEAPRGGAADDLKELRGIGPKLESQLNRLGVWHFAQIADWSAAEVAWIDDHLEGFKGRVLRDDWIGQARELTATRAEGADD